MAVGNGMAELRDVGYDEFGILDQNAAEADLPFDPQTPPTVHREWVETPLGHEMSALVWGEAPADFVLLHGGGQNAHTWDTLALALGRPAIAIDLPGHGHSAWRDDQDYRPQTMADDLAFAIAALAPQASSLVGMSLGGLTGLAALADHADLADHLGLVDITPGVNQAKAAPVVAFIDGPKEFDSFDAILERTMAFNPTRCRSSLVRGVLHNAYERDDGSWVWRYDRPAPERIANLDPGFNGLWDALSSISCPILLVQGGLSGVVDDDDIAEFQRRQPDAQIVVVEEAGHSVQGDRPAELAAILDEFDRS